MNKKIIYIHPGYGKTGTTFLQETIFSEIKNFKNLGRSKNFDLDDLLTKQQYQLFAPNYSSDRELPKNFSFFIKSYSEVLIKYIQESNVDNFILSDETICDRFNYYGELNLYHLKEVLDNVKKTIDIDYKFILTIRKQSEILISQYASDFARLSKKFGNYQNFLYTILKAKPEIGSIFKYDQLYKKIQDIYQCEILVLCIEEMEKDLPKYLKNMENFMEGFSINEASISKERINVNSYLADEKKYYFTKDFNIFHDIFGYLSQLHNKLLKYKIYNTNYKKFSFLNKARINIKNKLRGKIKLKEDGKSKRISNSQADFDGINNFYLESNKNLEKLTKKNLKDFGYY